MTKLTITDATAGRTDKGTPVRFPSEPTSQELLERLVDKHSLVGVLAMLASVCADKAVHVAEEWQDAGLAKVWDRRACLLDDFVAKFEELKG